MEKKYKLKHKLEDYGFETFDDFYENPEKYEIDKEAEYPTYILRSSIINSLLIKIGKELYKGNEGYYIAYFYKPNEDTTSLGAACQYPPPDTRQKERESIKNEFLVRHLSYIEEFQKIIFCHKLATKEKEDIQELLKKLNTRIIKKIKF